MLHDRHQVGVLLLCDMPETVNFYSHEAALNVS